MQKYNGMQMAIYVQQLSYISMAVVARVRAAWMKFRELGGILCTQGASLRMKGVVYKACVRSVLTYGAETWAMKARGCFRGCEPQRGECLE